MRLLVRSSVYCGRLVSLILMLHSLTSGYETNFPMATISMLAVESVQETAVMSSKYAANLAWTIYYVIGGSR